ncbi:hypothetical protein EV2_028945 [Malus domestica]
MTAPTTSSIYSVEVSVIQSPPVRSVATPQIFLRV